jgi:hypothetical protein
MSKIFTFFKQNIKNMLRMFNISIFNLKRQELVAKNFFIPFYKNEDNRLMKLYWEGLKKAKGEWSDNFSKKLRYYSLFQMAEYVLKKNYNMISLNVVVGMVTPPGHCQS